MERMMGMERNSILLFVLHLSIGITAQQIQSTALPTRCDALETKRNATWLVRDVGTMWSLNHTRITAGVRRLLNNLSVCQVQNVTATTNSFGEVSLSLPEKNNLQLAITFQVAGYYPITLRNVQLDNSSDAVNTFMEPLLFISKRFSGSGTAAGKLYDMTVYHVPNGFREGDTVPNVKLDFRTDMNNYAGSAVKSITSADGNWNVTLPVGHYTVTASRSGYITLPFTVTIVGGKIRQYESMGLCQILDSGAVRIASLGGDYSSRVFLPLHVHGPIENKTERAHTSLYDKFIPGSFVEYEHNWWGMQTVRIVKQLAGVYRISVSDWYLINGYRNGTLWDMANAGGSVQVYMGNKLWAQYYMPNRKGNAWSVVEINGTQLTAINKVATVTIPEEVH